MAATTFLIGSNASSDPDDWTEVEGLLTSVSATPSMDRVLEWEHQPYSQYTTLGNMETRGQGFPVVRWKFSALRIEQRENLRDFVDDVTTEVYIRTPTNETAAGVTVWKDYLCLAKWTQRAEIVSTGIDAVRQVEIVFEHCVDVTA